MGPLCYIIYLSQIDGTSALRTLNVAANSCQNGGLFCDSNGQVSKPFPDKPYCEDTTRNIGVTNTLGDVVSFCQTVLPGNEAMLIPTEVWGTAYLANPGTDYWCKTAAHYYINPPGVKAVDACVWGTNAKDVGNWSPYVAGTNTDDSGQTFIKLGWNPIYLEPTTPFRNEMPNWGVRIECPDGKCNGLPCEINPQENTVNTMKGSKSSGAGGGAFCVVTVPKGSEATFVVFGQSSGNSGGGAQQSQWGDAPISSTTSSAESSSTTGWLNVDISSSTTSEQHNSTTSTHIASRPNPSKQPNKNLFDDDKTAVVSKPSSTEEVATSATVAPKVTPSLSTGGAAQQQWSSVGFVVALLVSIALL